jgi:hypothetical protein
MLINDGGFLNIGNNNSKQASLVKTSRLGEKNAVSHGRSLVFMDGYNANLLSIIDKTRNPGTDHNIYRGLSLHARKAQQVST